MPAHPDHLLDWSDVSLSEVTSAGEVRINIGDVTSGDGFGANCSYWGNADGFVSCPSLPDGGGNAQVVWFQAGNEKIAIAARDARLLAKVGQLQPGDRAIVSDCDARLLLKKADNGITIFTLNGGDASSPMLLSVSGDKGTVTIIVQKSGDKTIFQMTENTITLGVDGGGSMTIDKSGVSFTGDVFAANCGSGNLGLIAATAQPLPGVNSLITGTSGITGIPSTKWVVAP